MLCQVDVSDLDETSFWVSVHEDNLACDDLFTELKQNFASKSVCKYMLSIIVLHHYVLTQCMIVWLHTCSPVVIQYFLASGVHMQRKNCTILWKFSGLLLTPCHPFWVLQRVSPHVCNIQLTRHPFSVKYV